MPEINTFNFLHKVWWTVCKIWQLWEGRKIVCKFGTMKFFVLYTENNNYQMTICSKIQRNLITISWRKLHFLIFFSGKKYIRINYVLWISLIWVRFLVRTASLISFCKVRELSLFRIWSQYYKMLLSWKKKTVWVIFLLY